MSESSGLTASPAVKQSPVARALLAGFIASTVMMYVFPLAFWGSGQSLRFMGEGHAQLAEWIRNLTYNGVVDRFEAMLSISVIFHLVMGMVWAIAYALWAEPRMSGSGLRKGVLFSLIPWVVSIVAFLPMAGAGFLGLKLAAGPLPVIGNLVLHLVYGVVLGMSYGPLGDAIMMPDSTVADRAAESTSMNLSTQRAAKGLVLGLVLGALVGTSFSSTAATSTSSVQFALMTGIVCGGALGCLVGAFAGLPTGRPRRAADRR